MTDMRPTELKVCIYTITKIYMYVYVYAGHFQARLVYYLMNVHTQPRCIYLCRVSRNIIIMVLTRDIYTYCTCTSASSTVKPWIKFSVNSDIESILFILGCPCSRVYHVQYTCMHYIHVVFVYPAW